MKVKRYPSVLRWFLVHDHILNRHRNTNETEPENGDQHANHSKSPEQYQRERRVLDIPRFVRSS